MGRKRGIYAGWFVEIPPELKAEFQRLYPGRRSMKVFTIAFVSWAIRVKPDLATLEKAWVKGESNEGGLSGQQESGD